MEYDLRIYTDDNYRERCFYGEEGRNPACYCMGPGCNVWLGFRGFCSNKCHDSYYDSEDSENLSPEEMVKLKEMLRELKFDEAKKMSAQEILDWATSF